MELVYYESAQVIVKVLLDHEDARVFCVGGVAAAAAVAYQEVQELRHVALAFLDRVEGLQQLDLPQNLYAMILVMFKIANHFYCYSLLGFEAGGAEHRAEGALTYEFLYTIAAQHGSPETLLIGLEV